MFIDADYSQIELRILAHMSGDEKLIAAYNSSEDIHRATAAEVFNTPIDEVTPLQRKQCQRQLIWNNIRNEFVWT